jgi:hypothetical protein
MNKFLGVFTLLFIAAGCGPKTSPCCGPGPINNLIIVQYVNKKGEDLLNPAQSHAITTKNTNLYYLIDGQMKKVYDIYSDLPKGSGLAAN